MKFATGLILLAAAFLLCSCKGASQSPQTAPQADVRIGKLLDDFSDNCDSEEYQAALADIDEVLDLCNKFKLHQDRIYTFTDKEHFALLKLGRFDEALKVALALDALPEEAGNRKSAWNYLKIADTYFGMKDYSAAIQWMEKAVYERGFRKFQIFESEKYAVLQPDSNFQKAMRYMQDAIGLQHPAKNIKIALLNGDEFDLSAQNGKVVLIDFWDVACPPCIRAMPELKNLFKQYHERGLEIVGISLDTDRELLRNFLEKNDLPWKIACSYNGWKDETAVQYGVNATPSTWLIDRDGILQGYNLSGEVLEREVAQLIDK